MIIRGTKQAARALSPQGCRERDSARVAIINREYGRYFRLDCGCYADREIADIFRAWAPDKMSVYCERHNTFVKRSTEHEIRPVPDIPLF